MNSDLTSAKAQSRMSLSPSMAMPFSDDETLHLPFPNFFSAILVNSAATSVGFQVEVEFVFEKDQAALHRLHHRELHSQAVDFRLDGFRIFHLSRVHEVALLRA